MADRLTEEICDTLEDYLSHKTANCDLTDEQESELKQMLKETKDKLADIIDDFNYYTDEVMSYKKVDEYVELGISYNSYFGGV